VALQPAGLASLLVLLILGCTSSRLHVNSREYIRTVPTGDEDVFLADRASGYRSRNENLPVARQRQEFFVRWEVAGVQTVKFAYRQANEPDQVRQLTATPGAKRSHLFVIGGEPFVKGGAVTAWQVTLWRGDELLLQQKSALW
jgi:hypothetical protein